MKKTTIIVIVVLVFIVIAVVIYLFAKSNTAVTKTRETSGLGNLFANDRGGFFSNIFKGDGNSGGGLFSGLFNKKPAATPSAGTQALDEDLPRVTGVV